MLRAMIAFAVLVLMLAGGPAPAEARVTVEVRVGSVVNHGRRITCSEGRRMLVHRGFRDVRARDCRGTVFTYSGRRQGHWWWIDIRARDGRILRLQRRR